MKNKLYVKKRTLLLMAGIIFAKNYICYNKLDTKE